MTSSVIQGPVYSIVTPFKSSTASVDYYSLFKYIDAALDSGAKYLYSMAFNTRYAQLEHDEILALNSAIISRIKYLDDSCTVIVGDPIACPTSESKKIAHIYSDIGADLVSILFTERYYNDNQIFDHFEYIADGLSAGLLIHEMPLQCGLGGPDKMWPLSLMERLVEIPQIKAIKEDAKDDNYTKSLAKICANKVDLILSGGGKKRWLNYGRSLCPAWLNGLGVAIPKFPSYFWKVYLQQDIATCNKLIDEIESPFFDNCVSKYGWHPSIRVALHVAGFCDYYERMPMFTLDQSSYNEVYSSVRSVIQKADMLIP